MTDSLSSTLAADYAAALDWWRVAGVDLDYREEPTVWLREPVAEPEPDALPPPHTVPRPSAAPALERALAREPAAPIGGDPAHWPSDLAGFRDFWLTEPSLDPGALADRVAPVGEAGAELLLLIGQPEDGDREALLSGEQGALVSRILRAMGIEESRAYLASALPRITPMPDWDDLASRGLAALTCHHLKLAAPRRVIIFGKGPSMLARESGLPTLAAPQLETLARSAAHKRRFWNQWLEWSAPSAS
jgi:DNA polymerase